MDIVWKSSNASLLRLLALTFLYFIENFDRYLIAVSPIPYIDYSSYEYSVLAGPAFAVIYSCSGLLISLYYTDKLEGKTTWKMMLLSLFSGIFSIVFGLTALATEFYQQVLIRVVMGLTQSIITPFSISIIRESFDSSVVGAAVSIFNVGTYIAFSLSLSLGTYLYVKFGWQAGYILFGMIGTGFSIVLPCLLIFERLYNGDNENKILYKNINTQESIVKANDSDVAGDKYYEEECNPISERSSVQTSNSLENSYLNRDRALRSLLHNNISQDDSSHSLFAAVRSTNISISSSINSSMISPAKKNETAPIHDLSERSSANELIRQNTRLSEVSLGSNQENLYQTSHENLSRSKCVLMKESLQSILCVHWRAQPAIYLICLATAVRLGAGYIWSSYTSVFFSDLFESDSDDSSCSYSFDESTASVYSDAMCSSDFPFCVDSTCKKLADYPWHNQGMTTTQLVTYMSWVPLVGSGLGSVTAGFLSDFVVRRNAKLAGEILQLSDDIPIRSILCCLSNFLAIPLVVLSFFLSYPGCFLIYIASGMVGEVYLSQSLAILTDESIIPRRLISASVALFMLTITILGGNATLLIPSVQSFLSNHFHQFNNQVTIHFTAADSKPSGSEVDYAVLHQDASKFQYAMMSSLVFCYLCAGLLYFAAYCVFRYSNREESMERSLLTSRVTTKSEGVPVSVFIDELNNGED